MNSHHHKKQKATPTKDPYQTKPNNSKTEKNDMQSSPSTDPTHPKDESILVVFHCQIPLLQRGLQNKQTETVGIYRAIAFILCLILKKKLY